MPSFLVSLANWFMDVILTIGYPGIFLAMLIEGIITPIPSEIIMPFAGYLASEGHFNIVLVILVGSLGATIGAAVAYYIGYSLGRPFIKKYGKYFRLKEEHIDKAEKWFEKYGDIVILIGHSLPGIRSFISFPAGIAKMKIRNFLIFTFTGAMIWNTFLALLGYYLGKAALDLAEEFEFFDIVVLLTVFLMIVGYFLWRRVKKMRDQEE
jgi:membrane protein DedA with SNARE-associated domain